MRVSRLVGVALGRLYGVYYRTLRLRALLTDGSVIHPRDFPFHRELFALSERDAFALAGIMAGAGFTVMVAHGRDGDWAAAALETIGCAVVRGSSRRGGARALTRLIRTLDLRQTPARLVVDGPLGPVDEAKPGIAFCAMQTGRPLRVLGAAPARAIVFVKAWSQIYLPLPFSRVMLYCDDPIALPDAGAQEATQDLTREISRRLARARSRAIDALAEGADLRDAARSADIRA